MQKHEDKKEAKNAAKKVEKTAKKETVVAEKSVSNDESQDLSKMTVAQLREIAAAKGITGVSTMKKSDLLDKLK